MMFKSEFDVLLSKILFVFKFDAINLGKFQISANNTLENSMTLNHVNLPQKTFITNIKGNKTQFKDLLNNLIIDQTPGEALEILEKQAPSTCIVLTRNPCPDYLSDLLAQEPAALLANGEGIEDAFKVLEVVASGGRVISLPAPTTPALTPCERAVLRLIARARCDKRIARQLGISDGTVRKRVSEILDKLELENRMQLGYYYFGLWSLLAAFRDRMPVQTGEHLWGLMGTNVHSAVVAGSSRLEAFELAIAFGHSRAPQVGSITGGFMVREVNDNEALEVVGGWVPRYQNPDLRDVPPAKPRIPVFDVNPPRTSPVVPWWKMPMV
jgi:DNA-binding CsgD family transcriptional regulator